MDLSPIETFLPILAALNTGELEREIEEPRRMRLAVGDKVEVAWAPFDHVNPAARIVICGITPGRQQMGNALRACHAALMRGASPAEALEKAKVFASFSGSMRTSLVAMLDEIGVNRRLGIASAASLWGPDAALVHFTSAMRYPVFVGGRNHTGARMLSDPLTRGQVERWLTAEMAAIPKAIYIPLGPAAAAALEHAALIAGVDRRRILSGLPHPSGANGERIAYFLGRKPQAALSAQTDPGKIGAAKARLLAQIADLEV